MTRLVALLTFISAASSSGFVAAGSFTEDFTTTTFRDAPNTTADWNTVDGELKLFPFSPATVGSVDTPGNARFLQVAGNYAYLTDASSGLQVVDISDPAAPFIAATYGPTNNVQGVSVYGDYAFLADGSPGILVIDVTDPTTPTLAGSYNPTSFPDKVAVKGKLAVAPTGSGIEVLDITDPTTPTQIGTISLPGIVVGDLAIDGQWAFVADFDAGLQIVDISDPVAPSIAGSFATPGNALGLAIEGDIAYVADSAEGLQVVDITDPTAPALLGALTTPGSARELVAAGDRVYIADGSAGLQVVDVTDPANPVLIHTEDTPGTATGVAVAGEHAFVADGTTGLRAVRIAEAIPPIVIAEPLDLGTSLALEVEGNRVYSAAFNSLVIVDVTQPDFPVQLGSYPAPGNGVIWDVAVDGDIAVVAADSAGVLVLDVSDGSSPTLLGTYASGEVVNAATMAGDHAYIADGYNTFRVLDISDPSNPVPMDSLSVFQGGANDIQALGSTVFWTGGTGMEIIDVSDPGAIVGLSDETLCLCNVLGFQVSGDYAYVATTSGGLNVVDISNLSSPVGHHEVFTTAGIAQGVSVSGDLAVVSTLAGVLHVLDVSNPLSPIEIGSVNLSGNGYRVVLSGQHAYMAGGIGSLQVVQVLQDEVTGTNNAARSLTVDDTDDPIVRGRVTPTGSAGFTWELSANGGTDFEQVEPGTWLLFANPGNDLRWRSSLSYPGQNPATTSLTVDWLNDFAEITSISDVPNDQGKQVRVEWRRSGHDFLGDADQIVQYALYRKIDPDLAPASRTLDPLSAPGGSPLLLEHAAAMQAAGWDFLTTVPVRTEDHYAVIVPTLADSTIADGSYLSTFMVSALTAAPGVFFDSPPDSGYSLDNLAPGVPQGFAAAFGQGFVELVWDPAPEEDFQHFRIYRSNDPGFVPGPATLVHETIEVSWQDNPADPGSVVYKITALDFAGNESDPASSGAVTAVGDPGATPPVCALRAAVPNPMRTGTNIAFELPHEALVTLEIFDVSGRRVRSLVDGSRPAGRHEAGWNGVDDAGARVASGVYLYRLRAGSFASTRRLVIVR